MASQVPAKVSVKKEINQVSSYKIVIQDIWSKAGEPIKIPLPINESGKELNLVMYCNKTTHDVVCNINDNCQSAAEYVVTLYPVVDRFLNLPISKVLALTLSNYVSIMPKDAERSKYFTSTGTVTISITPVCQYSAKNKSVVPQHIHSLFMNPQHADITLIVDGERLPAHKNILCSSSPVFQAMFQHPMKEAATNEVVIVDHSGPAVKAMLHFVYTGTIPEEDCQRQAVPLMALAVFYQIQDLAQYLEHNIEIGLHNIKELLQAVPTYGSEDMLERVMQFVVQHANELMRQPTFLDGLDPEVWRMMLTVMAGVPLSNSKRER